MTDFSQQPESMSNRAPQAEQIVRTTVSGCYQNSGSKFTVSALIDWDIAGELTVSLDGGAQTRIIPVDYTTKNFTYNIPTLQEIAFELDADGSTGHTIEVYYTATPATIIASTTFDAPDSCEPIVCGINDLGGFVFQDYNSDGVNQSTETQGLAAVTVTAIDVNGGVHATTTDRYGLYVLPIPSDDYPVRVEFTDIPANPYLSTSTPVGTNNDTTVQFIDAPTCNVDLGVNNPLNNCGTSDPLVVTSCYVKGDPLDLTTSATYTSANLDVLVGLPYSDSITPSSMEHLAVGQQMGATWGQAYDLYGETLYSTPILRRHVGLGPDGIGAIYATDMSMSGTYTVSTLVDLMDGSFTINLGSVISNTARGLNGNAQAATIDAAVYADIAKVGIGDIDSDTLNNTLWFTNLYSHTLHSLVIDSDDDPVTPPTDADLSTFTIPDIGCVNGIQRPWATKFHEGDIYVGVVCDASSGAIEDLQAAVLRYDPLGAAWETNPILQFPLTYPKGEPFVNRQAALWNPWTDTISDVLVNASTAIHPQPIFTDIEFDIDGSMVLGFGDRTGFQVGWQDYNLDGSRLISNFVGGDILRAYNAGDDVFILENNGTAGPFTGHGPNNEEGPGLGEFYNDNYVNPANGNSAHTENALGALALLPGSGQVVSTNMDPVDGQARAGGLRYFANDGATAGTTLNAVSIYITDNQPYTLGKAAGLGDVELICELVEVLEIGNRIWADADRDGIQDPDEPPIENITVHLYDAAGTLISTKTSDSDGLYYFDTADGLVDNTDYYIVIDPAEFTSGGELEDLPFPTALAGSTINDSNGVILSAATIAGLPAILEGSVGASVSTGNYYENDHSIDFGFIQPVSVGSYIWDDANHDGLQDDTENGISGVTVELLVNDGSGVFVPATTLDGALVARQTTDSDGLYIFDDLPQGQYRVRVTPPNGYVPSSTQTATDDDDTANDSNIARTVSSGIYESGTFTVTVNGEPVESGLGTFDGDEQDSRFDTNGNMTIDFGFTQLGTIGNYVWVDENSDGVQDEGERGIPNVTVQLKDSAGTVIATTTTDSQGGYLFTDLPPADYFVDVDESTIPTGMTQTDPYTNNIDGDDADAVTDDGDLGNKDHDSDGYPITLDSGEENLTADFGYNYNPTDDVDNGENTAALGDRIWIDSDGDGVQDPNEVGVSGATLTLITAGPDGIFGTADDVNGPTTTTDANGYYIFDSLTPGAYQVEVTDDTGASHDILGADYQQTGDPDHFATSEADHPNDNEEDDNKATVPVVLGPGDVFLNVDFGYQPDSAVLNSVGDTIFYDADMDGNGPFLPPVDGAIPGTQGEGGTADASDYGIAGVTVALIQDTDGDGLWDAGEPIIATDITDSNGQYLFEDLPDDDYLIWVNDTDNVLDGLTQSYDSDGALGTPNISAVDLDDDGSNGSAVADRLQDFGYGQSSPLGVIGDTVWFDVDNSGGDQTTQGAEPGIAGVTVNLYQDEDGDGSPDDVNGDGTVDSNDIIKSTVTNGNGNYLFDQLPFGGYVVEVDTTTLPAQYDTTATYEPDSDNDDLGTAVTLTAAAPTDFNQDFSYTLTDTTLGSIGDQVWGDLDSSGTNAPNAGDVPLPGVTVQLTDSSGNVQTTVTDGEGYYLFPNLPADTYTITVDTTTLPAGFTVTPTYDPDAPDDSQSVKTLTAGEHDRLQDFSYPPGGTGGIYSLGDRVWFDANNSNGDQATQGSEPSLQGVTVTLLDDSGNVVAETTTDVNGDYLFTGLTAGQYTVTVDTTTLPSYASPVSTHDGSDDAGTPDGDATSADITVGPGADAHKRAEDFSFPPATPLGGLGDTIFIDDDNTDGDDFEPNDNDIPLEGVTVILTYPSGVTVTTVTDENGKYYFGNLPLNETYTVTVDTTTLPGGDTNWSNTADPNSDDNSTSTVILTPASPINLDQDFGYQASAGTPGSIGNLVWEDVDADGLLDTGEAGIPGVTLDLYYDANGDGEINPGEPRIGTATTDGSGAYLFDGLPIDDGSGDMAYIVDVTDRDGVLAGYWHSLSPNQDATTSDSGSATTAEDDDDNSKADAFPVVLTTAVPNNLNVDFGYYKEPASLGNYVWYDADADGIQDSGESGVDGITVTLTITYPNGDMVTLRTVTGDDPSTSGTTETGWYSFDNLLYDEDYRVGSGTTVTGTNQPAYAITVDTGQYVPTFNDVTSGGGNDQNDSDLSGVVALPTQGSETVTQNSDPELESDPIATYDFGVVRVDLGDLPDTSDTTGSGNYQTVLSDNGAAHTILDVNNDGTPDAGQIYLGATIDAENEGQQSTYATGDGDDEDGVTVNLADWENGTDGGQVGIDVTGGSGYVVGWFDFDNDGVFDTMVTQAVTAGSNNVNVDVPASTFLANGSSGGSNVTVYARFRLFTDETAANAVAGGALSTTAGFDGLAVNGEVEDYVWNFTPTAVGLAHNTTTNQPFISIEVLVVLFLMLLSASVLAIGLRRRSAI